MKACPRDEQALVPHAGAPSHAGRKPCTEPRTTAQPNHGGNIYAAARLIGRPAREILDFSANINPLGPSPRALRAIAQALSFVGVYPDPECVEVRQALAACYRLEPDQVLVGNGASELIDLLPRSLSMRCALVLGPTFTEYARAVTLAGGRVLTVNAERGDGYRPPIGRVLKQLRQQHHSIDAVFVCNPNNPTGQLVDRETLAHLVDLASQWGLWILVDESFIDFCGDQSVLPFVSRYPRLLVLRSLTKFYALPGLRIGYLVGAKAVVEAIRAQQPPWSVNALAQVAAVASLKDHRYARRAIRFVARERERLQRGLESIPGMRVYPSAANFLLVELPRACLARTVAQLLCQKGILIRDCSGIPGLSPQTIRVAVRSEAQNCRLIKALKQVLRCSHSPTRSSEGLCRL